MLLSLNSDLLLVGHVHETETNPLNMGASSLKKAPLEEQGIQVRAYAKQSCRKVL